MDNTTLLHQLSHIGHTLHTRRRGRPAQERILHIIHCHGEITQKEIMEILRLSQGSCSELILKLESRGLIKRRKDPQDARRSLLSLTEEGRRQEQVLRQNNDAEEEPLLDCLNEEEKETLNRLLQKIIANWEEDNASC